MFRKASRPEIKKLSGSLVSGSRQGFTDAALSPRSPFDFNSIVIQSPRGVKNYEVVGVGLGIVAALDKSGAADGADLQSSKMVCGRKSSRSERNPASSLKDCLIREEIEEDDSEEYTYVTTHGPDKKPCTKVYFDKGEPGGKVCCVKSRRFSSVFEISTARCTDLVAFPSSDFLSSCHMCRKSLHGEDIFMYRGEKAFCSNECRYKQIVTDERKEKCRSEASRSNDVSNSNEQNIISNGILAR